MSEFQQNRRHTNINIHLKKNKIKNKTENRSEIENKSQHKIKTQPHFYTKIELWKEKEKK